MTHYFEKTIVDAKTIYTDYLLNILTPILYYGIKTIYDEAKDMEIKIKEAEKINSDVRNPGVLQLFQLYLSGLDKWTDAMMDQEANRIRSVSGCADIFDDLVRAVVKSHIVVLTYSASKKTCKIIQERLHEKVQIKSFIHCCYLECAKIFFDHPTLFFHEFNSLELKENERKIYQLIKIGIKTGIKRVLPMKQILETYLGNDYIENDESEHNSYTNVKKLITRDLYGNNDINNKFDNDHVYDNDEGGIRQLIDDYETPAGYELDKIESLIFGNNRNLGDTLDENIEDNITKNNNNDLNNIFIPTPPNIINTPNVTNKEFNDENINDKQFEDNHIDNKLDIKNIEPEESKELENQNNHEEEIKIVKSHSDNKEAINHESNHMSNHRSNQNIFDEYFKKTSKSKKKSSIIDDAIKSLKNSHGDSDIKIERKNINDNYFE